MYQKMLLLNEFISRIMTRGL